MITILERLRKHFLTQHPIKRTDAFSTLIATILSQNTSDINSSRAFKQLCRKYPIKPNILAFTDPEKISQTIKIAGLHKIKGRRIVSVSKLILEKFNGEIEHVFKLPLEDARKKLMSIRGIGPKTADVLLAFAGDKQIVPIDTHVFRVTKRIGLSDGKNYEKTRIELENTIPKEKRLSAHFLLIKLGRTYCKAQNPKCDLCPINDLCEKRFEGAKL
jgi:endonuclease-3